jgi:cytochrome P450 family 135
MIAPALRVDLGPMRPMRKFVRVRRELDDLLIDEIRAHRADPLLDRRADIVSLAVRARSYDGSALTDAEVRDEILTLAVTSCAASTGGLAWALELLLRHPAELAQVRETLTHGDDGYLELAIDEALRLRTPLFALGRAMPADYRFGRYVLPAGTGLLAPLLLLYRSPSLYRNPTLYRPGRFLAGDPRPRWVPFGGGIRACLGAAFAKLQIATVLEQIVTGYDVRLEDPRPERIRLRSAALVAPDREVPLRVVKPLAVAVGQRAKAVQTRNEEVFAAAHRHE